MTEFVPFPKIPRLNRDVIVTEKIDGSNAQLTITDTMEMFVGSRKRWLEPTKAGDNFGFARWAYDNEDALKDALGPGTHFGEWWGSGIQRGYGLEYKRFSLFNTHRWEGADLSAVHELDVVPTLYIGPMTTEAIELCVERLRSSGSHAAPGFMRPEGVIVYHTAARSMFKVLLENDELPKGVVAA